MGGGVLLPSLATHGQRERGGEREDRVDRVADSDDSLAAIGRGLPPCPFHRTTLAITNEREREI